MLPFLDRQPELRRLLRAFDRPGGSLIALYGRRRLGKSRLLREALAARDAVYYVGDERDGALQRASLAREIARLIDGFDGVVYPDWEPLLRRWWTSAPPGAVLALDEFPWMVSTSPELPGLLQKLVDEQEPGRHLALCGSSQRMMLGLLLDGSAPLYGRATELLRLEPLPLAELATALGLPDARSAVEYAAVYGGVPRYWELAAGFGDLWSGVADLLLDPMGVLHREPDRILLDDLRETARAASLLALVGLGCHRMSEIAGRLGQPATNLTRPVARLLELGLLKRDLPWGTSTKTTKRTLYRIGDPLLAFWFRYVEPNRSRLGAGRTAAVLEDVRSDWPRHLGPAWEVLVREQVARRGALGEEWLPPARWWGPGRDRRPLELDLVAESARSPDRVLVGEVKLSLEPGEVERELASLRRRAEACPALEGRELVPAVWALRPADDPRVLGPEELLSRST